MFKRKTKEKKNDPNAIFLDYGTDEQMEIKGYAMWFPGTVVTWIVIVLTFGFLRLVFYWKPNWMLKCTHRPCPISKANKVLLKDKYETLYVEDVETLTKEKYEKKKAASKELFDYGSDYEIRDSIFKNKSEIKYFLNKRWKYIWSDSLNNFDRLKGIEETYPLRHFQDSSGLTFEEQYEKRMLYGENSIRIHLTPTYVLFFREVLSPFYIFQIFSCSLWYNDDYYYYASCIVFLSIVSITYTLWSIRRNERALRDIIHHAGSVTVFRRDPTGKHKYILEQTRSENLVPGDVILIENMTIMQCDALLCNGNVIVNESMLTGESVPVTKTAMTSFTAPPVNGEEAKLSIKEHNRHIIFSGTQVIQTRYYKKQKTKAIVLRTGFNTTKGELVRSILHPKPVDFKFNRETYKYIGALAAIAIGGMIYTMITKITKKNPPVDVFKRSMDCITIAVPPVLPAALTTSIIYAQSRLKKKQVYCISPRTINICGTINTFVFDKTGTLTEDGLDMKCVLPVRREANDVGVDSVKFGNKITDGKKFAKNSRMLEAMASCHSITRINGDLAGDPLDCKMFEFTRWELIEPNPEESENYDSLAPTIVRPRSRNSKNDTELANSGDIGIIKQFPFSSSLQRMSVVVRALDRKNFTLYCKGSPEKIAEMSKPETLPKNFQAILTMFTREGYRVIGVATRPVEYSLVKLKKIEREKLENDLEFLGLIVMENRLKPETCAVINRLKAANIRTIMCTGDNILTALSVARDCDLINEEDRVIIIEANPGEMPKFTYAELLKQKVKEIEFDPKSDTYIQKDNNANFRFAVTGKSFGVIRTEHKQLLDKLVVRGTVFARMSPDQKQQLIETLQDLGYSVGMCGDGANDCGALKAANSGISLSSAEASVASPFTSKNPNIECVPLTIREGRTALVTSFGIIKFICMYSMIQFISVVILYSINCGLTDFEFLYIDLGLATLVAFFFSRTTSYSRLNERPPASKLMAWRPITSLIGHLLITFAFQLFVFFFVKIQPWYTAYDDSLDITDKEYNSFENTVVFLISSFQYLTEAVVFSKGPPYRMSIYSNYSLTIILLILLAFNLILTVGQFPPLHDFFNLRTIPDMKFRIILVFIAILNFYISFLFEKFIMDKDFNERIKEFLSFNKNKKAAAAAAIIDEDSRASRCNLLNRTQTPYQKIENEIKKASGFWPPITLEGAPEPSSANDDRLKSVVTHANENLINYNKSPVFRRNTVVDKNDIEIDIFSPNKHTINGAALPYQITSL